MPIPLVVVTAARTAAAAVVEEAGEALLGAAIHEAGRAICNAHANNPGVVGSLGGVASGFVNGMCNEYYGQAGIIPPAEGARDFNGGQCAGVQYLVRVRFRDIFGSPPSDLSALLTGPLGPMYSVLQGTDRIFRQDYGTGNPRQTKQWASLADQGGQSPSYEFLEVTPTNGQPDNCGNLPVSPTPSPNAPDVNYGDTFNVNMPFSGDVTVTIGSPSINIDGSLNLPVDIGGVELNFGYEGGASSEGGPAASDPPVTSGDPLTPEQLAANNGDFPDPPDGFEYIGAVFELTQIPSYIRPIPGTFAEGVYPETIGNARLKLVTENVSTFPSRNHQWREKRFSIIRENKGLSVRGVYASVKSLYSYQVIPLMTPLED